MRSGTTMRSRMQFFSYLDSRSSSGPRDSKTSVTLWMNNYNQKVKALNTLAKLRDKSGRPVVTAGMVRTDLADMKAMMNEILEKVRLVEEDVQ